MNLRLILAAAVTAITAFPLAPRAAGADDTLRTLSQQFDASGLDQLDLEFPVGVLVVDAWDRPQVQIEVRLECQRKTDACRQAAEAVQIASSVQGKGLELELKGWPKNKSKALEAHVQIHAPRGMAVDAELGVGELRINGMESDVQAELGVGDVTLNLPASAVATVSLESGVGEAYLTAGGRQLEGSGWIGKELRWKKGAGRANVNAECGVGDVKVALK